MAKKGFKGQWIPISRTGKTTDSGGVEHDLTAAWMAEVVANFKAGNSGHEAPLVIGHPKSDAPAFGWVSDIRLSNDFLEVLVADTDDEFESMVEAGRFKTRSGSFYDDPPRLKHVGFLGAAPPAVKGLKNIQFADGESFTFENQFNLQEKNMGLEDGDVEKVTEGVLEKIKKYFSKPDGTAAAGKDAAEFSEAKLTEIITGAVQTATEKVKTELTADFKEKLDAKDEVIESLRVKVDGQIAGSVRADIASFVESLDAAKGKHFLRRFHIADFLESLAIADAADEKAAEAISFSEGDGDDKTEHKFSRLEYAKTLLTSIAPMVEFGEKFGNIIATKEADAMINSDRVDAMKKAAGVETKEGGKD